MKRLLAFFLVLVIATSFGYSKGKTNKYMVIVPHTKEECMAAMDEMKDKGEKFLSKWDFGCADGDHTAYATLAGKDANAVKQMLPKNHQSKAKIMKVEKYSIKQIEDMHKGH